MIHENVNQADTSLEVGQTTGKPYSAAHATRAIMNAEKMERDK